METLILGNGFLANHLKQRLDFNNVTSVALRSANWKDVLLTKGVLINCIGKAHDHKGNVPDKEYYFANVELLQNIFEVFMKSGAELFIHISSLAALEETESSFALLEGSECHPVSVYGKSKRKAEEWLLKQDLPPNKKIIILRPPMIHRPGDKGNFGLLYKFISTGLPYPLNSFENQRSFLSIPNFVFFIEQIIQHKNLMASGIYHISDDQTLSTKDIIKIIQTVTGKKIVNINVPRSIIKLLAYLGDFLPLPINTKRLKKMTSNLTVSNSKIKNILGIKSLPFTAEEGLILTIKSFQQ